MNIESNKESYDFIAGEVLLFDKPYDWTSFDLVNKVRRLICNSLGVKKIKVGHAGTLDPLATGLLVVCTGKATKTIDNYQAEEKEYVATLKLGATTPSFDLETEIDAEYPSEHITRDLVEHADLPGFTTREQKLMSRLILAQKGNLRKVSDMLSNPDSAKAILALRLAVIFMHSRINLDLNSLRLKMKTRVELDLSKDLIASHPTISYWMEKEIDCWEDVDIDFVIKRTV